MGDYNEREGRGDYMTFERKQTDRKATKDYISKFQHFVIEGNGGGGRGFDRVRTLKFLFRKMGVRFHFIMKGYISTLPKFPVYLLDYNAST